MKSQYYRRDTYNAITEQGFSTSHQQETVNALGLIADQLESINIGLREVSEELSDICNTINEKDK